MYVCVCVRVCVCVCACVCCLQGAILGTDEFLEGALLGGRQFVGGTIGEQPTCTCSDYRVVLTHKYWHA